VEGKRREGEGGGEGKGEDRNSVRVGVRLTRKTGMGIRKKERK